MATIYKVNTANLSVYEEPYNLDASNQVGIIPADAQFSSVTFANSNYDNWQQITSCSEASYVGKYIYKVQLADGPNLTIIGDDGKGGEAKMPTEEDDGEGANPEGGGEEGDTSSQDNTNIVYNENGEQVVELGKSVYIDKSYLESYSNNMTGDEYLASLEEGLAIKDIRGILGAPHQFLPITDVRTAPGEALVNDRLGRVYSEKILRTMPLLLITPGVPTFMSSFDDDARKSVLTGLLTGATEEVQKLIMGDDGYSGKYYSLKYAYQDYFKYVNAMLRSAAVFLGIHEKRVDGKALKNFNWLYDASGNSSDIWGKEGIGKFLGPYAGCIAFYADCGNQVNDNFSNATTQSQLASTLNSLSDTGRELNFLVGNVGSLAGLRINALTGSDDLESNIENVKETIDSVLQKGNIMSNILSKATTILAGGRLVFPEIWSDSSFGRSYSCSMKLVSPSGDKLSVYLNILVPIYHLLGMCLPRQSIQQSYFSPFLLRCYYKGLFNVDMGLMTNLSITKGAEAEWIVDGIPTVAEVSFEIKDLYEGMFMSKAEDSGDMSILANICELDYIANSCGININDQEVMRTITLWKVLKLDNAIQDFVANNIVGEIAQYFNQQLNNLFGVF